LQPASDSIREISNSTDVFLSCAIYSDEVPALLFDKTIILQIAALGAALDIDLYCKKLDGTLED